MAPGRARWASPALLAGAAVVATFFCFYKLGADRLGLDEAHYASATRNLLRPGNDTWLTATPYPGHPYFQKPPLYMWLSSALVRTWPDALWPFRAGSALFGVLTVVLTARLGWKITGSSITVGAFAAVLLATNGSFLYHHGARDGTMDTALALLATLAVLLVCGARSEDGNRPLGYARYVAIGLCCGLMSLFKPFAGLPMLAILATPALLATSPLSWSRRLGRFGVSLVVAIAVPAPWYVACAVRYGRPFLDEIVGRNVYGRIVEGQSGNVRDFGYYFEVLASSSLMVLSFPAVAYAVWRAWKGDRRLLPVLVVGAGMPLLFTLSAAKVTHYLYPAFPSLCVLIAIMLRDVFHHLGGRLDRPALPARLAGTLIAVQLVVGAGGLIRHAATERQYGPAEILATLRPAIDRGDVDIKFDGFPTDVADWANVLRLEADDIFWLTTLRDARTNGSPTTTPTTQTHSQAPTFLITNRAANSPENLAALVDDADPRLLYEDGQIVAGLVHADALLRPGAEPGSPSRYITLTNGGRLKDGRFGFTVSPPLPGPAKIHVEFVSDELTPDVDVRSRCRVDGERVDRGFAYPTAIGRHVTAPIELTDRPAVVSFEILPAVASGRILRAWLVLDVKSRDPS